MKTLFLSLIRGYQLLVSPYLSPSCRFSPCCSAYAHEAIRTHGVIRGSALAAWRIIRCNPWNRGGLDPVPGKAQGSECHQ